MTSLLRRLFGESESTEAATTSLKSPVRITDTSSANDGSSQTAAPNQSVATYTPNSDSHPTETTDAPAIQFQEQLNKRFTAGLRQVEAELVSNDPITADLKLLLQTLREQKIEQIRQLPLAAQRALSLLHAEASTSALVTQFEKDPVICQALLKQVNSAYYNPNGARVVSLSDAINRMGRAGVQSVVMEQTLAGMVSRPGGQFDAMVQQVWDHMVRVAPLARHLAPAFGANADQAFLLGLLHDVGKLAVFDRVTDLRTSKRRTMVIDKDAMGRALSILHEPLGGLIVEQWQLDADVARAVATHHRDPRPVRRDVLSEVVFVAERVDLASQRKQFVDLPAMWDEAGLTASMDAVTDAVSRYTAS
ncbi:MAG TPA: HDOD domain-containing protein [Gemmatimonadaceae bacterium]